jgi:hypothetical protein
MKACSLKFESPELFHPSSLILNLRDGATGSTSDFDSEDEGSTPSPAANISAGRYASVKLFTGTAGASPVPSHVDITLNTGACRTQAGGTPAVPEIHK